MKETTAMKTAKELAQSLGFEVTEEFNISGDRMAVLTMADGRCQARYGYERDALLALWKIALKVAELKANPNTPWGTALADGRLL